VRWRKVENGKVDGREKEGRKGKGEDCGTGEVKLALVGSEGDDVNDECSWKGKGEDGERSAPRAPSTPPTPVETSQP
jgi:hypothetical protein